MLVRPFLGNRVYRNMGSDEGVAQYNRDLALYEQAIALKKLSETTPNQVSTTGETQYTPIEYNYLQLENDIEFDKDMGAELEYGSPEYIKYQDIKRKISSLYNKANYIALNVKGFMWFLLSIVICLGIPTLFITDIQILKTVIILLLVILPVIYLYLNQLENNYINKAHKLRNEKLTIIYNYRHKHNNQNKPEEQQKDILNLQK